ncbi:MAG: family 43 glycosylhydrolase [Tepidisphaeraceae bacterium]
MKLRMKSFVASLSLAAFSAAVAVANPVVTGADPDMGVFGNTYWMYPTVPMVKGKAVFKAFSSSDLQHWEDRGVILDLNDVPWVAVPGHPVHSAWAPSILFAKNRYYLYYAVGPQARGNPSRIGVAVADRPQGPFTDSGKPLVTSSKGFEAIDPMAFTDPKSGITYLYAGGSAGATLRVWELGADLMTLKREIPVRTPQNFTEGPFMHVRNGVYYLSYSHGRWSSSGYSVYYATAPSPTGPWTYKGCILSSDATHQGPGHHGFFENPSTHQWYIVYHRWETTQSEGRMPGTRKVAIEPISYRRNGDIEVIHMTDDGPPAAPIQSRP